MFTNYLPQQAFMPQSSAFAGYGYDPVTTAYSYRFQPSNLGSNNVTGFQARNANFNSSWNQINPAMQFAQSFAPSSQSFIPQSAAFSPVNQSFATGNISTGVLPRTEFGLSQPSIDISETKNDIILACDLPNANLNDLNLTVSDNTCSISAQAWVSGQNLAIHRTVPLSTSVKSDSVDASYNNGILQVRMPKKDVSTSRKINVIMQ